MTNNVCKGTLFGNRIILLISNEFSNSSQLPLITHSIKPRLKPVLSLTIKVHIQQLIKCHVRKMLTSLLVMTHCHQDVTAAQILLRYHLLPAMLPSPKLTVTVSLGDRNYLSCDTVSSIIASRISCRKKTVN